MRKKILAVVTAGLIAVSSFGVVDAMSRDQIAAIQLIRTNRKSTDKEISEKKFRLEFLDKRIKLLNGEIAQLEYRLYELDLDLEEKESILFALLAKKSSAQSARK